VRGREREAASYSAQRGWFDRGVQRVVLKWTSKLGIESVQDGFQALRRVYEYGSAVRLNVDGPRHLAFLREMAAALERLHDRENCAGWVIKLCGRMTPGRHQGCIPLLSYKEMAQEILRQGGPRFELEALRKAAQRLRVAGFDERAERAFHSGVAIENIRLLPKLRPRSLRQKHFNP
jgi:hypothetical protein